MLDEAGFTRLQEADSWSLETGGKYYVLRNDSALVAFKTGAESPVESGLRLTGAHTDSPCLKVKPDPAIDSQGYFQLGVEVYGGALLRPWFDRDLSLAGRVHYREADGALGSALVDFIDPVAVIPSLAIHLDREVNQGRKTNPQKEMAPILMQAKEGATDFDGLLLERLRANEESAGAETVLAHELFLYDTQAPALVGLEKQFLASARLDNLLSCYVCCRALIDSSDDTASVLVCNDHEEVGSTSAAGAQGPFLRKLLARWIGANGQDKDALDRTLARSTLISVDNAHGVHPNYVDKHDAQHRPRLNGGPVIKINANQRYASNSATVALFKALCHDLNTPCQQFVMRSDLACGSTIGPLSAAELGVETLDVGVPQFAMHSVRELAGSEDAGNLQRILKAFYSRQA